MPHPEKVEESVRQVCQSMLKYASVCQSMTEYAKVTQNMTKYAKVHQSMQKYAKVRQSMPKLAKVLFVLFSACFFWACCYEHLFWWAVQSVLKYTKVH